VKTGKGRKKERGARKRERCHPNSRARPPRSTRRNQEEERKNERKGLTLTGLLMEGLVEYLLATSVNRLGI
jgi:hypothetical protein